MICALLLFVLFTLYRLTIYLLFADVFAAVKPAVGTAFLLGAAFDMRVVAIIILFIYTLSFWPGVHYFKTKVGKKLALWLFGLSLAIVHIFNMADIVHLKCFKARLNGSIIPELAKHTPKGSLFMSKIEWMPMLASMVVIVWLFLFLVNKAYKLIAKMRGTDRPGMRIGWQLVIFLCCGIFIYGGFRARPLSIGSALKSHNSAVVQLALTSFESVIATLPRVDE